MPKRLGILLASALLVSTLAYCGDDDDEDEVPGQDAGQLDAAVPGDGGDAGAPADAGEVGDAGDAGGAGDAGATGDAGSDAGTVVEACGTPAQTVGRNLTVTCDGTVIDFSGEFGADVDDTDSENIVNFFFLDSADGAFTMFLDIYPDSPTCPATFALPFDPDPSVNPFDWYIVDNESGTFIADSAEGASTGDFTIEAFKITPPEELSFSCTNCNLIGEEDDEGVPHSCTITGTFREAVP